MDTNSLLQVLLNSCVTGIMTLRAVRDSNGHLVDFTWVLVNQKALQLFNKCESELIGNRLLNVFPELNKDELWNQFTSVAQHGQSIDCGCCWKEIGKERRWLQIEVAKWEDGITVIFQDHTEAKNVEIKLKENEERYKKAESTAHIGSWEIDLITNSIIWSDELYRIFGLSPQSYKPDTEFFYDQLHSEVKDENFNLVNWILKNGGSYVNEKRIIRPSGEVRWVLSGAELLKDANGDPMKLSGYFLDITDRKEAEIKLSQSEKTFRSLFENAGVGIMLVGISQYPMEVNAKLCDMLGYTREEIRSMRVPDFTHPDHKEKDRQLYEKVNVGELSSYVVEKRYIRKDGSELWVSVTISTVADENENFSFGIGVIQDISERKQAERNLVESERKLKVIFDSTHQFMSLVGIDGVVMNVNNAALHFAGISEEQAKGKFIWETKWVERFAMEQERLKEVITRAAQGELIRYEAEIGGVDGKVAIIDFSLTPILDETGNVVFILAEGRDITEKKKEERLLVESEQILKLFITQAPTAIALLDKDLRYIAASKKWSEEYHISEEIIGKKHYDLFPEISEDWKQIHKAALQGKIVKKAKDSFLMEDGTIQWLKWEVTPWYDVHDHIAGLVFFTEDITEEINNEEAILSLNNELKELNQQKIKLFSVIAHDMKGPIANCLGLLDVISINKNSLSKEDLYEYLKYLEKAAMSVNDLIEELLMWARSQFNTLSFDPISVNFYEAVNKVLKNQKQSADNKAISIETSIDPNCKILADENMLNSILRNLISNAIKFTQPRGKVKVQLQEVEDKAIISVIDNGVGISEDNLHQLLDTKSIITTFGTAGEKGTGLGLSLCINFLEKHGSKLQVASKLNQGSTFSFALKLAR